MSKLIYKIISAIFVLFIIVYINIHIFAPVVYFKSKLFEVYIRVTGSRNSLCYTGLFECLILNIEH